MKIPVVIFFIFILCMNINAEVQELSFKRDGTFHEITVFHNKGIKTLWQWAGNNCKIWNDIKEILNTIKLKILPARFKTLYLT